MKVTATELRTDMGGPRPCHPRLPDVTADFTMDAWTR